MQEDNEGNNQSRGVRRIVVQDTAQPESPRIVQGRRLADPPNSRAEAEVRNYSAPLSGRGRKTTTPPSRKTATPLPIGKSYLFAGLGAGVVAIALVVAWAMGLFTQRPHTQTAGEHRH